MTSKRRGALGLVLALLLLQAPASAQFRALFGGPAPTLTYSGAASGSVSIVPGTPIYFTTTGSYTIVVNRSTSFTLIGIAAGGAGRPASGPSGNGAGGGGSGSITTGTTVQLDGGKVYTLVIPPAATSTNAGASLTFTNTTDAVTLVSLGGGQSGAQSVTGGTAGIAVTGSNLANGVAGGVGCTEAVPGTNLSGTNNAAGAGGGGGGTAGDGGCTPGVGGTGHDETNPPAAGFKGGHGGGYDFNGVKAGGGGGGADGVGASTAGDNSQQGAAKLTP